MGTLEEMLHGSIAMDSAIAPVTVAHRPRNDPTVREKNEKRQGDGERDRSSVFGHGY